MNGMNMGHRSEADRGGTMNGVEIGHGSEADREER
jgi:hypothetical protein